MFTLNKNHFYKKLSHIENVGVKETRGHIHDLITKIINKYCTVLIYNAISN